MAISLLLVSLALAVHQCADTRVPHKILLTLASLGVVAFSAVAIVSDRLTGAGFNEAVIYHLQTGLEGAAISDFTGLIWVGALAIASTVAALVLVVWVSPKYIRLLSRVTAPRYAAASLAVVALGVHSVPRKAAAMFWPRHSPDIKIADYKVPDPLTPVAKPVNFVWIYGESLERTYFDESLFPGLTPGLKALEAESLSFADIRQYPGTEWTVAGMVASQCGVPLPTLGGPGGSLGAFPVFLPRAVCLGDLLAPLGYQLTYIGGADLNFAGKGKFYHSHSFRDIRGLKELEAAVPDKSRNSWGIYDDQVFDVVLGEFNKHKGSGRPFGLFTLTTGTHHPVGNIPAPCQGIKYGDGSNPMLNAVRCSDQLITGLVRKIRSIDQDTVIVVSSDHLAQPNAVWDLLQKGNRRDLFMINWPGHIKPEVSHRVAGTYSEGVTVLNILGFPITELGLGRSLIQPRATLAERYADFPAKVGSWLGGFSALWDLPETIDVLTVDPKAVTVTVGRQTFPLPVAINLDEKGRISRIAFDNPEITVDQVVEPLKDERLVWVDACKNMYPKLGRAVEISEGWCVWRGGVKNLTLVEGIKSFGVRM